MDSRMPPNRLYDTYLRPGWLLDAYKFEPRIGVLKQLDPVAFIALFAAVQR